MPSALTSHRPDARIGAASTRSAWTFRAALFALLAFVLCSTQPYFGGDALEYTLDAVAIARHGTPDIRLDDIARNKALAASLAPAYEPLESDMRAGVRDVYPAFARGKSGAVYPIHFFGYPLLAALPMRALEALGANPMRGFQVVNYAFVFILGMALLRFLRSPVQASLGLMLFMLCGGMLHLNWTSPECSSAAGLLAALLFYLSGAPLAGGILAGLAAQQNPTIVMFFGFAPLLELCLDWQPGTGLHANLRAQLTRRKLLGLTAGLVLFALPLLFNQVQYGALNIIAKRFSDPGLIGIVRLVSFFFDLNQGMIVAIPGVLALLAALTLWGRRRTPLPGWALPLTVLFVLALIVPALAVLNWNSGAAGAMRYAFWASMPFVMVCLLRLRAHGRWPPLLVLWLALAQGGAMLHASRYSYVEFSPLARLVLDRLPNHYHPEPEVFAERMAHNDDYIQPEKIYVYRPDGHPLKALVNPGRAHVDALLCGAGRALAPGNRIVESTRGWRYVDGPLLCMTDPVRRRRYGLAQLRAHDGIALDAGWGQQMAKPEWDGVWSDGPRSRLVLTLPAGLQPDAVSLFGDYAKYNQRTRVTIDGVDLGWQRLDRLTALALPAVTRAKAAGAQVTIELQHEAPQPPAAAGETGMRAFFLHEVELQEGVRAKR